MPVPPYYKCIEPLLRALVQFDRPLTRGEAIEAGARELGLTEEDLSERIPSGQPLYQNRLGWAYDRLKRHGLAASPRRGYWSATPQGRQLLGKHSKGLPEALVTSIAQLPRGEEGESDGSGPERLRDIDERLYALSPTERIDQAVAEIRDSVAQELLEIIARSSPRFFESLVLELLHAMGYGTSRDDLQHVGGSGDGGIDGIISLDRLGLEKVYVQAKRWQGSVGGPIIQTFLGALQLQGANKGVLLTTGTFTKDAKAAADRAHGRVVLVDGVILARLMIEYGVGVSHKEVRVPRVDGDYFEAEA
ncbi:MAG: restriction endonuclease [Proteobacteria bacterium]|nr:restriction endonuclease [Pseudomonadota bacterium]